jgi:hypothetical protein
MIIKINMIDKKKKKKQKNQSNHTNPPLVRASARSNQQKANASPTALTRN